MSDAVRLLSRRHVRLWTKVGDQWTGCGTLDECHKRTVRSVAFSPDSRLLATASFDATTEVFRRQNASGGASPGATARTVRDGRGLTGVEGWLRFLAPRRVAEYVRMATLEGHENEVKSVAWAPSGALLATCGRDKSVWIWESTPRPRGGMVVPSAGSPGGVGFPASATRCSRRGRRV